VACSDRAEDCRPDTGARLQGWSVERMAASVGLVELHPFKTEPCEIPPGLTVEPGAMVIIQDEEGEDLGRLIAFVDSDESRSVVLRLAGPAEIERRTELDAKTAPVVELFTTLKDEYHLHMRVVGAHWRLDHKKVCFYFASEERLDFRALHKAVSSALNVRVAIKQIGVRDHARILGGLGPCGREICCKAFIRELRPIALRMARQQNLFVEPAKISGLCGKLLCCLGFEDQVYQQWLKDMPMLGTRVATERGIAVVTSLDVLKRRVNVRYDDATEQSVALEELGSRPKE
jgi:cell fate regulator YaaT (PSP1 superfamily)